jgi:hypothetical protein
MLYCGGCHRRRCCRQVIDAGPQAGLSQRIVRQSVALQSLSGKAHVADEFDPKNTAALHARTQLLCYNNIIPPPPHFLCQDLKLSLSSSPLALTLTGSMAVVDRLEGAYVPNSPSLVVIGTKSSKSCPSLLMGIAPFFCGSDFTRVCNAAIPAEPPLCKHGKHCPLSKNDRFYIVACLCMIQPFCWTHYFTALCRHDQIVLEWWIRRYIQ